MPSPNTQINALNVNFSNGALSLANSTATVTTGTAITNAVVGGKFITTPLTNSAAVLAPVNSADGSTVIVLTPLLTSQACILVHCVNAAGARKELQGPVASLDATGAVVGGLVFPKIPDSLCPVAYSTVKAGLTSAGITFATSNWDATGNVCYTYQVSTLPARPLTT